MEARPAAKMEKELRAAVAARLGESRFGLWFGEGVELGVDGDALVVGVPNGFFREWIQGHFTGSLEEAGQAVTGRALKLRVKVAEGDDLAAEFEPPLGDAVPEPAPAEAEPARKRGPTVPIPGVSPGSSPARRERERDRRSKERGEHQQSAPTAGGDWPRIQGGRPGKRLEDFVVGAGNRLAHAAAVELVQSAGASFSPLVLHGGVGLGKTHLLEGIATALRARYPSWNLLQTTAEGFTNSFVEAMRVGSMAAFRNRFRKVDAFLVDDVHFLAAKQATQEEFLHTFNALMTLGAPIVLTADQHPRRLSKLPEELMTRFLGGMVLKLEAPDPATRRAILIAKAAARGVDVPAAVVDYIAEHLRSSVRELEGALNSVVAHAMLTGKRIDLNLARGALRDTIRHTSQAVALKDIERAVCELFQVDVEQLRSDSRARKLAQPRMMAMFLARKHTGASYSEIGRHFGGRNHSTVISAEKKVRTWLIEEEQATFLAGFESISDIMATLEQGLAIAG